jgi:hypothetical protein
MAVDLKSASEDGPEREALRGILRQWEVPPAPPEIEEELRRAFRRRRARRWGPLWLSLAAVLVLLLVGQVEWTHRRPSVAPPEPAHRRSTPQPSSSPAITHDRPASRPTASVRPLPEPPRPSPRPDAQPVIVEPGQRDLLVQLAERLQSRRQPRTIISITPVEVVPAGVHESSILEMTRTEVPRYEGEWERVADVWPLVQLSAPTMGR